MSRLQAKSKNKAMAPLNNHTIENLKYYYNYFIIFLSIPRNQILCYFHLSIVYFILQSGNRIRMIDRSTFVYYTKKRSDVLNIP